MKNIEKDERKIRVMFVDDEPEKVGKLVRDVKSELVEIIAFEPFFDVDETFRDISNTSPDVIFMDHWLVRWAKNHWMDGDKVIKELVDRGYNGKFVTNTGGWSNSFDSVSGLRNSVWKYVIMDHAWKNKWKVENILSTIQQNVSLILDTKPTTQISRRTIREKILKDGIEKLSEEEKTFLIWLVWGGRKTKERTLLMLLLYPNIDAYEYLRENKIKTSPWLHSMILDFFEAGILDKTHPSVKKAKRAKKREESKPQKRDEVVETKETVNIIDGAREKGFENLSQEERENILDAVDKEESDYMLKDYIKIKSPIVYGKILEKLNKILSYTRKDILEKMIEESYESYKNAPIDIFDILKGQEIPKEEKILIMLKDPEKKYADSWDISKKYGGVDMDSVTTMLSIYASGWVLGEELMDLIWAKKDEILHSKGSILDAKSLFSLMSFPKFHDEVDGQEKERIILDAVAKWKKEWKLSEILNFGELLSRKFEINFTIEEIENLESYHLQEVIDFLLGDKISLDKEKLDFLWKKLFELGKYEELGKMIDKFINFNLNLGLNIDLWTISKEDLSAFIWEYRQEDKISALFGFKAKIELKLSEDAIDQLLREYRSIILSIGMKDGKLDDYLEILDQNKIKSAFIKSCLKQTSDTFNFWLYLTITKKFWTKDEIANAEVLNAIYSET